MSYRLLYFASLADRAGRTAETLESDAPDPLSLYAEISARHGFAIPRERLRVAVNGALVDWRHCLQADDEIVFLPPVSGG